MPLITRNVFIDTEFFVKANLDFNSSTLKSFVESCQQNEFRHMTTTIVVKEVERKIRQQIHEALNSIRSFRRKGAVLKEYDDENISGLFREINEDEVHSKALSAFEDFIQNSQASVVDMSRVDINEVIDMHFDEVSPFSKKKPNEFRDAFTLLALRDNLGQGESIYVISDDPDLKAFCEENDEFEIMETLSELLDEHIKDKDNNLRIALIHSYLEIKKDEITQRLKEEIEGADAYNESIWEDSEIDSFKAKHIELYEPKIIYLDDESCQITFDITVGFDVHASGPDTTTGIYDKEDGVLHTFGSTSTQEEEEKDFSVELDLNFDIEEGKITNDEYSLLVKGLSGGIAFGVEEYSSEDYW